ncbi:TPA_exp: Uncharacterized protein A8136_6093 [Trichophyton benhamiae CBS 112371]|uniref:Uncharacterized protein n=1 Tax=Arthroderma benhamiae (strain ATCC MYA-4681 / CBS 112371) TaxID=663331 RepID=D4AQ75_ARTBC|nr:uncharacterized protein ARB_06382 [Trichophyton benhamiae CBS 112371]EFE34619.1 conserved hypothetical protein [Trichophyton benhamiae CBS 112371]DAA77547.1 TPA_exp: Uncharacterized protein A8136_6093 [Trichophyton benhamiae CBS 112371]
MPVRNHLRKEGHRGQLSPLFPRHELKISGPLPHPLPAAYEAEPPVTPNLLPVTPNVVAFNPPFMSSPRQSRQPPQTPIQSTHSETSRPATYHPHPSPGAPVSHTHQESLSSNVSNSSTMHRRRGSTLKTVMRKIFGRKPRDELDDLKSPQEIPEIYPHSPDVASLHDDEEGGVAVQPPARFHRSSSLPSLKNSIQRSPKSSLRGLGSPSQPWSSSEFLDVRVHRRRATLPSVALSAHDALELASKIDAAATFDKKSSIGSLDALVLKADNHYKRRSRSACGVRDTAKSHRMSPIQWRRRSDEIRFWRESTLNDFAEPRPDTRPATSISSHIGPDEKVADASEESADCPIEEDESDDSEPNDEEGFDFKNLMESMQTENEVSLAQRVGTLEVKLMDLEFAIAKLQNSSAEANTVKKKATGSPVRGRPMEPINDSSQFINSFVSTPSITPPQGSPAEIEPMQHSSPITLCNHSLECISQSRRPPSPYRSDSGFQGISVEQYSALTTLMRREQCARKLLESQILSMQQEIRRLQTGEPWGPGQGSTFLRSSSPDSQMLPTPYLHDSPRQAPTNPWKPPPNIEPSQNDNNSINSYRHNSDSSRYNTYHRSRNDYSLPHNNHIPGMI